MHNDISKKVIEDAVKKCYKSLLFVPTKKINNLELPIILKYIEFQNKTEPNDKMTKEIKNLYVNNGYKKLKLNH